MASRRSDEPDGRAGSDDGDGRLRGADAFRLHLTLAIGLAVCTAAFVFEVTRALGGNTLSWAYVFEWPIFAVFAVYMWWHLLHGHDGSRRAERRSAGAADAGPSPADAPATAAVPEDPDLVAWQGYLRSMEAEEAEEARQAEEAGRDRSAGP